MEKTRLQSVGHHFDASVLTTHSGTFGGGFATGHRRPQWIYRYDAQQIEVRTMNKLAEHIFARITTSQLACDLADELEIEYVCSATLCNLDVLLICTADRFSNESRLFVYDPCLGRQRQLPLPKGRSITCAAVSAPFQIQTPYEMEEENQNEDCTKTIQLLLLGTGTSEMYINHLLLSDDPFGIDPLLDANHYKRLPESHSGPITSIACWTDVLTEQKPSNIICIAWGTSRGKVLLVEYHFNQVMSNGSIEDQFYYIEAIEIADHGQITQIIIQPLENGDTISDSAEEASDDGQSDVAKGWYCIVAQDGTQTRGKPSIVPLVSVCKTIPQKKKWMAVGHVTPFSDSARTGIYGRTLSMALVKKQDALLLYSVYYAKHDHHIEGSTRMAVSLLASNGEGVQAHVKRYNLSNLNSEHFLTIYPVETSEECFLLCADQMISMPASPALSLEIEDEEETNQRKLEQAKMDSDHAIALFKLFPYDNKTKKNITAARKLFGGHLCIDRLLTFAGVEIGSLYPPSNEGQLKKLICAIYECDLDQIKKDSIVYYLIRECQDNTIINSFIQSRSIPLPYQQAITGYWLLDHERYKESITWLCMPTVSVDWPDDVLAILCQSQLYNLAEQFIQMRQWKPSCLTGVQRLFDTLLHTDLLQALLLQRQYSGHEVNEHGQLFTQLLDYCFNGEDMKTKLNQLMRATLNKEEEKQLAEYCEDFEAPYRLDFLIMYHVHHINYVEAIQLNERARQREDPRRAVSRQVMRRNAIIENLRSLLPRVQRNAMEVGMSLNQTLGQSSQNQHFPLVTPLLSSVSNARHLPPTALSSLMQSPHGSYGPVVASGLPPLSTSKDINQIEGQSAEESEISLLRVIALHQARQQSPHLALSQLLEQEQQQQQSTTSVNKFSSSNTASAETANVSAHKRNQSNTSNSAAKRVQSPEWAKRMDASLSPVMIGHENEDSYSNDTASNYQRRKSTPLPPLRRNSPFPPRTPQSPHQDSSNGSPHPSGLASRQLRASQRRGKVNTATSSATITKHQLIMSEDEEEVTETPTRRSRATKHTTTASSAITRSARRRPNIRQRGDTDDITRTPGAFPTEQSTTNMTPAKNSRPRAHSPRKKTKTAAEQEELVSSRRTTRARNLPAVEDESEALKKMPRNPSSHLIRNGDTPWPPRIQPHTRPRNNNNNSNNNSNQHRGRSGTSKKEMEMSTMTPKTTRRTRTKESVDITADNNNNNNGQTSSLYRTPSKKPASSMTEIATDNNSTPQRQVRMLTRSMRRANNAHGSGSDD